MAWISFGALPCRKRNLITVRVAILLKSRASLTCFRACFLPGRAKDLSAPRYYYTDFFYMAYWNTRTRNLWQCSEIPVMWIGFKPQISVCSKCVLKPIRCVHPEGMHLQTNVCIRNSHDNAYACFTRRHFLPSHSCRRVANDIRNAELNRRLTHGLPSFYANCQAEVPESVRFLRHPLSTSSRPAETMREGTSPIGQAGQPPLCGGSR